MTQELGSDVGGAQQFSSGTGYMRLDLKPFERQVTHIHLEDVPRHCRLKHEPIQKVPLIPQLRCPHWVLRGLGVSVQCAMNILRGLLQRTYQGGSESGWGGGGGAWWAGSTDDGLDCGRAQRC